MREISLVTYHGLYFLYLPKKVGGLMKIESVLCRIQAVESNVKEMSVGLIGRKC